MGPHVLTTYRETGMTMYKPTCGQGQTSPTLPILEATQALPPHPHPSVFSWPHPVTCTVWHRTGAPPHSSGISASLNRFYAFFGWRRRLQWWSIIYFLSRSTHHLQCNNVHRECGNGTADNLHDMCIKWLFMVQSSFKSYMNNNPNFY